MDDGMTTITTFRNLPKPLIALCVLLLAAQTGCQPQSRSGLFGSGNSSTFGVNSPFNGTSFNNPFGNIGNNTASGTFNSGSTFGQLANSAAGAASQGSGTLGQLPQPGLSQEFSRINQQLGAFDADNQLLNTEVASLTQKLELANQYNQTLKQQLADTSDRITQSGNQDRINQQQFTSMQQRIEQLQSRIADQDRLLAQRTSNTNNGSNTRDWQGNDNFQSSTFQRGSGSFSNAGFSSNGSATIRANNGLMQKLDSINIPGGNARMDGDIIRIEFPTDRLFTSGSYRIAPAQLPVLQNIASTIRESFPRQIVGIEAHWDGTPLNPPGITDHQLTATQSLAVLDELVRLGLPERQLFNMALGSNRPRHQQRNVGGVSPNRRIELVIYPESYDR